MQLNIGGKKYTIVYTIAATMCDDLLETITGLIGATGNNPDERLVTVAGRLPALTKSLLYGGLLQMHGEFGDNTVRSKKDAEKLLFQYMTENEGKREGKLAYIFDALYTQMGEDNFLSRIGLTDDQEDQKVTPISRGRKPKDGGAE